VAAGSAIAIAITKELETFVFSRATSMLPIAHRETLVPTRVLDSPGREGDNC
jgi:hypothetical protein